MKKILTHTIAALFFTTLFLSCQDFPEQPEPVSISVGFYNVTATTATIDIIINGAFGDESQIEKELYIESVTGSVLNNYTYTDWTLVDKEENSISYPYHWCRYQVEINGLERGEMYKVRVYVSNDFSSLVSEEDFTTESDYIEIRFDRFDIYGGYLHAGLNWFEVQSESDFGILMSGFCWRKSDGQDPTINDDVNSVSIEDMELYPLSNLKGLEPNTRYSIRAYAISDYVVYSETKDFDTDENGQVRIDD